MAELEMRGLAVGAMGAWLSAVGLLRALHRADPSVTLHWQDAVPVLRTALDAPEREVTERMVFSPVVTPWQSGGGWGPKDKEPARRLEVLRQSSSPRLALLRRTILAVDEALPGADGDKDRIVRTLRNTLPELALAWLDVAVPLHDDPKAATTTIGWAPIAGTGGNDGRWDVSTNYHAAILAVASELESHPGAWTADPQVITRRGQLADLLWGTQYEPLAPMSGGPYWPQTGDQPADRLLNPWAMILTVEGMLAFGDEQPRTYDGGQPWSSPTLATWASGGEAPAELDEPGWGEAWLPLWPQPMTLPEVRTVLGGPWPRWRGRLASRPANLYTALRTGGFPRGITGVARYGMARRRGLAHQAVLLDLL